METEDLRIGNYVFGIHEDDILTRTYVPSKVLALDSTGTAECNILVESLLKSSVEFYHYFEPIPLTEGWFLKFGFEFYETEKSKVYRLDGFLITYVVQGRFKGKKYLKFHSVTFENFGHIQSVHQLQNLYFALTNKELKTK
jgi:hypothetical protein